VLLEGSSVVMPNRPWVRWVRGDEKEEVLPGILGGAKKKGKKRLWAWVGSKDRTVDFEVETEERLECSRNWK